MNKNFYSIKEVLYGLRKEYIMYLNDMNNLKKYLITRTDEFQDFNLVLGKNRLSKIENNN